MMKKVSGLKKLSQLTCVQKIAFFFVKKSFLGVKVGTIFQLETNINELVCF